MKVTVIGKEYISGTSKKTGRPFEANLVHVSYKKNGVEGQAVEGIFLDPNTYPLSDIQVGKVYNVDRDNRGYLVAFDLA